MKERDPKSAGQQVWPQILKERTVVMFWARVLETTLITFSRTSWSKDLRKAWDL